MATIYDSAVLIKCNAILCRSPSVEAEQAFLDLISNLRTGCWKWGRPQLISCSIWNSCALVRGSNEGRQQL